jgi:hypothetical protein
MDESGEHISEYNHDVYKERLDARGRLILKEKSEGKLMLEITEKSRM